MASSKPKDEFLIGLFNWQENEQTKISYPLIRTGLNENKDYEVYDFWVNKYLGNVKNQLLTVLEPASCQVKRF